MGHQRISYGGRIPGFENYTAYYPRDKLCVIVLANRARVNAERIHTTIAQIYFQSTDRK